MPQGRDPFSKVDLRPIKAQDEVVNGERQSGWDWFRRFLPASKQNLDQMEKRLTDAIKENAHISPCMESAAMRVQSALDKLDASIPDKK